MFSLTSEESEILEKAVKRVRQMDTTWLLDFADQSVIGMEMGLEDWRKLHSIESMTEIWGGLLVLMAVVREIEDRYQGELTRAPASG